MLHTLASGERGKGGGGEGVGWQVCVEPRCLPLSHVKTHPVLLFLAMLSRAFFLRASSSSLPPGISEVSSSSRGAATSGSRFCGLTMPAAKAVPSNLRRNDDDGLLSGGKTKINDSNRNVTDFIRGVFACSLRSLAEGVLPSLCEESSGWGIEPIVGR